MNFDRGEKRSKFSFKKLIKWLILIFFLSTFYQVLYFKFFSPAFTPVMFFKQIGQLKETKEWNFKYNWVTYEKMSPYLPLAVIASEDQRFPDHWGFDIEAIEKALKHNKRSKRIRGASTISQQVAKNMFLWSGRDYIRKGLECYYTILIELLWSKERIIEVYLNVAEMGQGVYGVEAASQKYFKKDVSLIEKKQAALLAAILPNPVKYSAKSPGPYVKKRQKKILREMNRLGGKNYLKNF